MQWNVPNVDTDEIELFAGKYGTDALTSRLLLGRNILEPETLKYFLNDDIRLLHNPFLFSQMDLCTDRLLNALEEEEKVMVFGDRDVDGITSTALMVSALRKEGLEVFWEVPMGDDHYGLQMETVEKYAAMDVSLIITVDCGIGNVKEVEFARSAGIDSIIIDHHNPGEYLPDATAIINPKSPEESYPFQGLSAVALVFKVLTALDMARSDFYNQVFCFLNLRPGNDSIIVEAVKLSNLVEQSRITETFVNSSSEVQLMRVIDFISDQAILVYQQDAQLKLLEQLLGPGTQVAVQDIAQEVWKQFPALKGKSLLRMLQGSKLNKFSSRQVQEIDAGVQLLVSYLYSKNPSILQNMKSRLDLVSLGLIADMMPLLNENRIMVKQGMKLLSTARRPGLRELIARLGLLNKDLSSQTISWKLTPAINATGRMGRPDLAVKLLLEEGDISSLADEIYQLNEDRKRLGNEAWEAVVPDAKNSLEKYDGKLALVYHPSIHRGITGILAGRLARLLQVPAFVIADLEEHYVGSVRSIRGFHVTDFLSRFSDIFDDFGGHDAAGGFHFTRDQFDTFSQRLEDAAPFIELDAQEDSTLNLDLHLSPDMVTEQLEQFQASLEPRGMDFQEIRYMTSSAKIENCQVIGKDQYHLRLLLNIGRRKWPAVFWSSADRFPDDFQLQDTVQCAFTVERNYFGNNSNMQLNIIDIQRT